MQPIKITFQGETRTLKEWSAKTGINVRTLRNRYSKSRYVWNIEDLLTIPSRRGNTNAKEKKKAISP